MAELRSTMLGYHSANAYQLAPLPAFCQPGDLLVAVIGDRYLPTFPSGWYTRGTISGTNQSGKIGWKVLTGADIGAGSFTYTLAAPGTGSFALLAFKAGTYRPANDEPISEFVQSIATDADEDMIPWLAVERGQTIYHYATARTAVSGELTNAFGQRLGWRDGDPGNSSALYGDYATDDGSKHAVWQSPVESTGAYKVSFVVNDPRGTTTLAGIDGTANVVVEEYSAATLRPYYEEHILNLYPTLTAQVYGSPEPFTVQFETYVTGEVGESPAWTEELTGQVSGEVSATVDVPLVPNRMNLWRVRAGNGVDWSNWSPLSLLYPFLNRSYAHEAMHLNAGPDYVPADDALEVIHYNGGIASLPADDALDYQHVNQGFLIPPSDVGAEYLHESVTTGQPAPHLWFAYLDYGFDGDYITLVGQGLGNTAEEFASKVQFRYSTVFNLYDFTVEYWNGFPGTIEGLDERRRIYRGADGADYIVNVEHDVVGIRFPLGVIPPKNSPTNVSIRFSNAGGYANPIAYTLYPKFDVAMSTSQGTTRSSTVMKVTLDQESEADIEQIQVSFAPGAITAVGGMLERPPKALVSARSTFALSGQSSTSDLEIPNDVTLTPLTRWRPLATTVEARPDLGTGVSLWEPSSGPLANAWRIVNGTEPYVDDSYEVTSRNGLIARPAMIFPGDAHCELESALADGGRGPSLTVLMVATIYPRLSTGSLTDPDFGTGPQWSTLFETTVDGGQPAGTSPFSMVLSGDTLKGKLGESRTQYLPARIPGTYLGKRPVIIALTLYPDPLNLTPTASTYGRVTVVSDDNRSSRQGVLGRVASGSGLILGKDAAGNYANQRMDILDLAVGPALSFTAERRLVNALDSAYGVSS